LCYENGAERVFAAIIMHTVMAPRFCNTNFRSLGIYYIYYIVRYLYCTYNIINPINVVSTSAAWLCTCLRACVLQPADEKRSADNNNNNNSNNIVIIVHRCYRKKIVLLFVCLFFNNILYSHMADLQVFFQFIL